MSKNDYIYGINPIMDGTNRLESPKHRLKNKSINVKLAIF